MSGLPSDGFVMNSEVIDLHDTGVTCKPWPDVPLITYCAVGGLINDKLLICGGINSIEGPTSLCHAITPSLTDNPYNTMTPSLTDKPFKLANASYFSAGVVLDQDTLLISGGRGNQRNIFVVNYEFLSFYILYR